MNFVQSKQLIPLVSMPNIKILPKNNCKNGSYETKRENEENGTLNKAATENINETRMITVEATGEKFLIPPFVDLEYGKQIANNPKEKALLWNRLRHGNIQKHIPFHFGCFNYFLSLFCFRSEYGLFGRNFFLFILSTIDGIEFNEQFFL